MIEEMRTLIEQAIVMRTSNHRASIGLTEAEAAAVYACKQHYQVFFCLLDVKALETKILQKGDIIMICDAGGGTTVSQSKPSF